MKWIWLTQYIPPNGKKVELRIKVGDKIAEMSEGMELSGEVLMNGMVALYAKYPTDEEEMEYCELCKNGPEVQGALEVIIKRKFESRDEERKEGQPCCLKN